MFDCPLHKHVSCVRYWRGLVEFVVQSAVDSLLSEEVTVVMGYCKESGNTYVIHTETKRI